MLDEAPAVGGDEGGREAAQVIGPGIQGKEGKEYSPLRGGEMEEKVVSG